MISLEKRIEAFANLGHWIGAFLDNPNHPSFQDFNDTIDRAFQQNGWFERREVLFALHYWHEHLSTEHLKSWTAPYSFENDKLNIAVIAAGNIPMVGFHDVLSVLISGHKLSLKTSSSDAILIPFILGQLLQKEPSFTEQYRLVHSHERLKNFDAVLATGSNNSARYFEQYFGKFPNMIRKNRTGVAILDGNETEAQLEGLMIDMFQYFGLGCRNVTHLYLPKGYDFDLLFKASLSFEHLMSNKKYANNYLYHKSLMMMDSVPMLENDLIVLTENERVFSPVSITNYTYYSDYQDVLETVDQYQKDIQCVVSSKHTPFGTTQSPSLSTYADGLNTLKFLTKLNEKGAK